MNYATEATIPAGAKLGTRDLHFQLRTKTSFLVIAPDYDAAVALIGRSIGEKASQQSFTFDVDDTHRWFRETRLTGQGSIQGYIDTLRLTQRQLGSIQITGATLSFENEELRSFWIESRDADTARVLTGERRDDEERFFPLADDWQFHPALIASTIIGQY